MYTTISLNDHFTEGLIKIGLCMVYGVCVLFANRLQQRDLHQHESMLFFIFSDRYEASEREREGGVDSTL